MRLQDIDSETFSLLESIASMDPEELIDRGGQKIEKPDDHIGETRKMLNGQEATILSMNGLNDMKVKLSPSGNIVNMSYEQFVNGVTPGPKLQHNSVSKSWSDGLGL